MGWQLSLQHAQEPRDVAMAQRTPTDGNPLPTPAGFAIALQDTLQLSLSLGMGWW